MKRLTFKLGLFVVSWYEVGAELGLHPDTAFLVTLALFVGFGFARGIAGQIIGMIGPFTFGILLQAVLWIVLLWWLAPGVFHAMPFVFDLLIVLGLALVGARCRFLFEEHRAKHGPIELSEHSGLVLIVVFGALAACAFAMHRWGSLWPLLAYAALPVLPFSFGWRMGPLAAADRPDARFGSADDFRNAGLSEDR
jgi:hypothetical protein